METLSHNIYVENLTEQDLSWFVEVAAMKMLLEEVKRPELVNLNHLYALATKGMEEGTAFIAKRGYEPIGALGALLLPNTFNPDLLSLAEIFWYVLPEHRNSRAGALLFSIFDKCGKENADEAVLSLMGSSTVNMKTLEKRGFMLGEFAFRKAYKET